MTKPRVPLSDDMNKEAVVGVCDQMISRSSRPYHFWAKRTLGKVLFKKGRALDVGSGSGQLLIEMAKLAPHFEFYGLDKSEAMLDLAKENIREAGFIERINLISGSAYEIPFENNHFNFVTSTNTLHELNDIKKFFEEAYRVLKPGGVLRAYAWRRNVWPIVIKLTNRQQKRFSDSKIIGPENVFNASYTAREVEEIITKVPFRKVTLRSPMAALTLIAHK